MSRNQTNRSQQRAFTITELIVALFVTAMVMIGIFAAGHTQLKQYRTQRDYMEIRQNLRVASSVIARDIRMAGYGLSVHMDHIDDWITWVPGITNILDFRLQGTNTSPSLLITGAMGETAATLSAATATNATTLTLQSGEGANFDIVRRKVIFIGRTELARVVRVSGDTLIISTDPVVNGKGLTHAHASGAPVELVDVVEYRQKNTASSYPYRPYLIRNNNRGLLTGDLQMLVAMGIEQMTVSLTNDLAQITLTGASQHKEYGYTDPNTGDSFRRTTITVTAESRNRWTKL